MSTAAVAPRVCGNPMITGRYIWHCIAEQHEGEEHYYVKTGER